MVKSIKRLCSVKWFPYQGNVFKKLCRTSRSITDDNVNVIDADSDADSNPKNCLHRTMDKYGFSTVFLVCIPQTSHCSIHNQNCPLTFNESYFFKVAWCIINVNTEYFQNKIRDKMILFQANCS